MVEIVMKSTEEITIICIGPLVNLAEAVRRDSKFSEKTKIVAMLGSLRSGWFPDHPPVSEYNVICSTKSAQKVFQTWHGDGKIVITPLDTCGRVFLSGQLYSDWKVHAISGKSAVSLGIYQNFDLWTQKRKPKPMSDGKVLFEDCSSTLFDTVAVFLAFSTDFLKMENLHIVIENDGKMKEVPQGTPGSSPVLCATEWTDMEAFNKFLVERLISK
jgi:inosine-uridine nucleoside N-ribohydrolase